MRLVMRVAVTGARDAIIRTASVCDSAGAAATTRTTVARRKPLTLIPYRHPATVERMLFVVLTQRAASKAAIAARKRDDKRTLPRETRDAVSGVSDSCQRWVAETLTTFGCGSRLVRWSRYDSAEPCVSVPASEVSYRE